jgi:uronate dehydrogenase
MIGFMPIEITPQQNVFVTGTRGRVGNAILPGLRRSFNVAEFDKDFSGSHNEGQIYGDITEYDVVLNAIRRVKPDCIVHLAANANQDATPEEIVAPNYKGLKNVYDAAAECAIPKIVFASSMHTHSGHSGFPDKSPFDDGRKLETNDMYNPGNPYGESKVWGENLAREYYNQYGIRTIVLRLGDLNADNKPAEGPNARFATIWLSHSDATQVFTKAVLTNTPEPVAIYFVTSDNDGPYNIQSTVYDLGYDPADGITKT